MQVVFLGEKAEKYYKKILIKNISNMRFLIFQKD